MDAGSVLGGIALGADASGNFRLSPNGIAVRRNDRYLALHKEKGHLIDVTEISFESPFVRIPTAAGKLREKKDVLVTSDDPFSALFVLSVAEDVVRGIDVNTSERVEYLPNENLLLKEKIVVKVAGLLDSRGGDLLPLLLLNNANIGGNQDVLTQLLLLRSLRERGSGDVDELLLLLLNGQQSSGNGDFLRTVLLLRSLREKSEKADKSCDLDDLLPFLLLKGSRQQHSQGPSRGNQLKGSQMNDPLQSFLSAVGQDDA